MSISPLNNTINYEHTSDKVKRQKLEEKMKNSPNANPLGELDKDAFMQLLLQELRYQDPTSPMDTDKMLTQTSQLASLETQEKTNMTMQSLAKKMELLSDSFGVGMIGAVGKLATLRSDGYKYDGNKEGSLQFNILVPKDFKSKNDEVKITMYNDKDQEVKSMKTKAPIKTGNNNYLFDMRSGDKDADGNDIMLPKGNYKFIMSYIDANTNQERHLTSSDFLITGVRIKDSKAKFLADNISVDFNDIKEFKDF